MARESRSSSPRPPARRALPAALAALVLLLTGAAVQVDRTDRTAGPGRHRLPGQLVDAGGFNLHMRCRGTGAPAVIIETGLGDHMSSWMGIQSAVSGQTRICVYDRAGTGWSDPDHYASSSGRMVRNLRAALRNAGVEGPYVLVGHSLGGLLVRRFAADHPDDVTALVLVDSAHENQIRHAPQALSETGVSARLHDRFCGIEAPMRLVRASGLINAYLPIVTPENLHPMDRGEIHGTGFCGTARAEAGAFAAAARQAEPPRELGTLPLIVLTAGRGMADDPDVARTELPLEALAAWDASWRDLQASLASLSTNASHRLVRDAGHFIQIDRPDAVIEAIRDALAMAQGRPPEAVSR